MANEDSPPFLVLTCLLDPSAKASVVTLSHGDAMERAIAASRGKTIAGIELVELAIAAPAFSALRKHLGLAETVVGLYDVFPLAPHLEGEVRKAAAQFLAAEAAWALEEQGQLGGVPLNLKLELPKTWSRDPKEVHQKLLEAGALELSAPAIETFRDVKSSWDASHTA